jgi:hypothetical protein
MPNFVLARFLAIENGPAWPVLGHHRPIVGVIRDANPETRRGILAKGRAVLVTQGYLRVNWAALIIISQRQVSLNGAHLDYCRFQRTTCP